MILKILELILTLLNLFRKPKNQGDNEAVGEFEKAMKDKNTEEVARWLGRRL